MNRARVGLCLLLVACRPPGYGKDNEATDASTVDQASSPTDAASATCEKSFRLDGHTTATSVWLTGSFVNWAGHPGDGAVEFQLGVDGGWTGMHTFEAGTHTYKFIISASAWIPDPTNPDQVDDGLGGKNSLFICAP